MIRRRSRGTLSHRFIGTLDDFKAVIYGYTVGRPYDNTLKGPRSDFDKMTEGAYRGLPSAC